jgi:hypothetical protein
MKSTTSPSRFFIENKYNKMATKSKKSSPSDSSVATFRDQIYTITTSLNDHAIYIKIVNNVSYMCYEGNFDKAAFSAQFDIKEIYKFVNKCFANGPEEPLCLQNAYGVSPDNHPIPTLVPLSGIVPEYEEGYSVEMQLDNGAMTLGFEGIVGGFLTVKFDLRIREKLMSNDAQLTINFQRVEQKQLESINRIDAVISKMESKFAQKIAEMERRLEALGHADICFTNPPSGNWGYIKSYPIDSKILTISDGGNHINADSFKKIKYFYQLEELKMTSCGWNDPNINASNTTVKKMTINGSNAFSNITFIKNFPSLEELAMIGVTVDGSIVTTLRSIKHKIKQLTFQGCPGINQTEMQTYCTQNGIKLNLS